MKKVNKNESVSKLSIQNDETLRFYFSQPNSTASVFFSQPCRHLPLSKIQHFESINPHKPIIMSHNRLSQGHHGIDAEAQHLQQEEEQRAERRQN